MLADVFFQRRTLLWIIQRRELLGRQSRLPADPTAQQHACEYTGSQQHPIEPGWQVQGFVLQVCVRVGACGSQGRGFSRSLSVRRYCCVLAGDWSHLGHRSSPWVWPWTFGLSPICHLQESRDSMHEFGSRERRNYFGAVPPNVCQGKAERVGSGNQMYLMRKGNRGKA